MTVEILEEVIFDKDNKIWKSTRQPNKQFCEQSLGEAFLKNMRNGIKKNKILDYFYDKDVSKTAQDIYEQSIKIAMNLKRLGIKKNDVIILYSTNNEWSSVLVMGSVLAGAQVNFFDVLFQVSDVDHLFGILQPSIIFYEENYVQQLKESLKRNPLKELKYIISIDGDVEMSVSKQLLTMSKELSAADFNNFQPVSIENPHSEVCCLLLTSGTTGVPKVVQLTHSQLLYSLDILWKVEDDTTSISFASLRWVTQVGLIFNSIILGAKRVSCNGTLSASYGKNIMQKCGITNAIITPLFVQGILQELSENDTDSLKHLRHLLLVGEVPMNTLKDLLKKHCPQTKYLMGYGMTEMCGGVAMDEHINGGKPLKGYQLMILDENQQPVEANARGQIAMKPPYQFFGYKGINSSNSFTESNFFINGDYGFVDEKCNLHALGRYKDVVKGEQVMIVPSKVEFPILKMPELQSALLIGYRKSTEDRHEIASLFIVLKSNGNSDPNDVRSKIHQNLLSFLSADELLTIRDIHFIPSVPLTTCGKADREALKRKAVELFKAQN